MVLDDNDFLKVAKDLIDHDTQDFFFRDIMRNVEMETRLPLYLSISCQHDGPSA